MSSNKRTATSNTLETGFETAKSEVSRWIRSSALKDVFQSSDLVYRCIQGGWLRPIVKGNRRAIYLVSDVLRCMKRIEDGEMPPARARSRPRKQATTSG